MLLLLVQDAYNAITESKRTYIRPLKNAHIETKPV